MERKETTMLSKVAFIALILCLITGITLTILDVMDILTGIDLLLDVIFCVGWFLSADSLECKIRQACSG